MAKVISYKLTAEGTVPSFVIDGGYYPLYQTGQQTVLIGIGEDKINSSDATVYPTRGELIAYLDTYASELFKVIDLYTQETSPLISSEAADFIGAKLYAVDQESLSWIEIEIPAP
jgi:hypothetical protein